MSVEFPLPDGINGMDKDGNIVPIDDIPELAGRVEQSPTPEEREAEIEALANSPEYRLTPEEHRLASRAIEGAMNSPEKKEGYPTSIGEVNRVRRAKQKEVVDTDNNERYNAYEELGGGLSTPREESEPFADVLDKYQPWHRETTEAVEQYGVLDMTADDVAKMPESEKKAFALHFYALIDKIKAHIRMIYASEGRDDPILQRTYGERTPEELLDYASTLKQLRQDLEQTGIPRVVRGVLKAPEENHLPTWAKRTATLNKFSQDRKKFGAVQIVFTNGKPHVKRPDKK